MIRLALPVLALGALVVPHVIAQAKVTMISPKLGITKDDYYAENMPYSWYATRYQQVHDAGSFDNPGLARLRSLTYRMPYPRQGGEAVEVAIWLSWTPKGIDSRSCSSNFATNIDAATRRLVLKRAKIYLPSTSYTNEWSFRLPFDSGVSFLYGGLLARNLLIETRSYGNDQGGVPFNHPLDLWRLRGTSTRTGSYPGCYSSNRTRPTVLHTSTPEEYLVPGSTGHGSWGVSWVPSIPAVLTIGGTPLNLPMPGSSCEIANDILVAVPGTTRGPTWEGDYFVPLPIPNDPGLGGVTFLTQMFFMDKAANQLGITSTAGLTNRIATVPPASVSRIYAYDTSGKVGPDKQTTGTIDDHSGLMVLLSN
ncbi:MAG: hypothetical protein R3F30_08020 [Planctomycetota bacterium]